MFNLGKTLYNAYQKAPQHTGSWGTKDFGVTEKIGSLIGAGTTSQGGSNIFPSNQPGQVQGLSTVNQAPPGPGGAYPIAQGPNPNPTNTSSGGTGGGSGSGQVDQLPGFFNDYEDSARKQYEAELASSNTAFDRLRSDVEGQLPFLQRERDRGLSSLSGQMDALGNQVGRQKEEAAQSRDQNIQQAGDTARQIQMQNRNMLRSLGILSSSAAGELLARPLNEFGNQRAMILQETQKRFNVLDDFLNEKTNEHKNAVESLQDNYARLIGQVQNDLRFNERERLDAVRSANAALGQRLAEIKQEQFNYQSQVDAFKKNLAMQAQSLTNWQNPEANLSNINALQVQPQDTQTSRQQVSFANPRDDEEDPYGLSMMG